MFFTMATTVQKAQIPIDAIKITQNAHCTPSRFRKYELSVCSPFSVVTLSSPAILRKTSKTLSIKPSSQISPCIKISFSQISIILLLDNFFT